MNKIIQRNGKEYLRISENIWKFYLDKVSPYKIINDNFLNPTLICALKDKNIMWCDTCNTGIGSWTNSCVKKITSINLIRYQDILLKNDLETKIIDIEIDRNDNNKVI
jgi:hypothetical protein